MDIHWRMWFTRTGKGVDIIAQINWWIFAAWFVESLWRLDNLSYGLSECCWYPDEY